MSTWCPQDTLKQTDVQRRAPKGVESLDCGAYGVTQYHQTSRGIEVWELFYPVPVPVTIYDAMPFDGERSLVSAIMMSIFVQCRFSASEWRVGGVM